MLRLQHIRVRLQHPTFSNRNQIFMKLAVSYPSKSGQNVVKYTEKAAKIKNEKQISWEQSLPLPILKDAQYLITIFNKKAENQNPVQQTFSTLVTKPIGYKSIYQSEQIKQQWDLFAKQEQKVGCISVQILKRVPNLAKNLIRSSHNLTTQSAVPQKPIRILRILSVIAKIPNAYIKKAHFSIQIGSQIIKSPEIVSRSFSLVFIEPRQIQLQQNDFQGQIKIFSHKIQQDQSLIGVAKFSLTSNKTAKKYQIFKDCFEIGQLYLQSRVVNKNAITTSNFVQNINKGQEKFVNELEQQQETYFRQRNKNIILSKSIDYSDSSKLDSFGLNSRISRPSMLNSSMVSTISVRKNSVLNQNGNIFFPREKRFSQYQDKQNEKITYLNERSLQFKFTNLGSRYKGASMGYGDKTDFSKGRNYPGVGNYKLPSIWDRY